MEFDITRLSDGEIHKAVNVVESDGLVRVVLKTGESVPLGFYRLDKSLMSLLETKYE